MKIHSNHLGPTDLRNAAERAGVTLTRMVPRGSQSHAHSWDILLSGNGPRRSQYGGDQEAPAATWDEWGMFLAELYRRDPEALCGTRSYPTYANAAHFSWITDNRFDDLKPDDQHRLHRWEFQGLSVTGSYALKRCRLCPAVVRRLHDMSWAEFART